MTVKNPNKITLAFQDFEGEDCKFFFDKKNPSRELGVIYNHGRGQGYSASIFVNGAWSLEIPVGGFTTCARAESACRKLFSDRQLLVNHIESFRQELNNEIDLLSHSL